MKLKYYLSLWLTGLLIFLIIPVSVQAQQVGLSLNPSLHEIVTKPNSSLELKFTLENVGDPALVSLKLLSSTPADSFGNMKLKSNLYGPILFDIKEYPLTSKKSFIMKSRESKKLTLVIDIPEQITEADYYYSLVAQTDPPPAGDGTVSAKASVSIASNILMSVSKDFPSETNTKIVLFDIPNSYKLNLFGKKIYLINSSNIFRSILTVQNNGIHRIKPSGKIRLIPNFGEKKDYVLPPQNILSESQRTLQAELPYRKNDASLYLQSISLGYYTMKATVNLPISGHSLDSSIDLVALPLQAFNWLFLIIVLTIIGIIFHRKKHHPDFETD